MSRSWPRTSLLNLMSSRPRLFVDAWHRPSTPDVEFLHRWLRELNDAGSANAGRRPTLGSVRWSRVQGAGNTTPERHLLDGQRRLVTCVVLLAALRDEMLEARSADEPRVAALALLQRYLSGAVKWPPVRLDGPDGDALAAIVRGDAMAVSQESQVAMTYRLIRMAMLLFTDFDARQIFIGLRRTTLDVIEVDDANEHAMPKVVFEQLNNRGIPLELEALRADPDWGRW